MPRSSAPTTRRFTGRAEDGARVAVDLGPGVARSDLDEAWPRRGLTLVDDDAPTDAPAIAFGAPGDLVRVESQLALFAAEHLTELVAIHATLLAWPGHVILLPGRSHAGKTTFALAAERAGARISSDEYALVDPVTALAVGWHRPLHVRGPLGTARMHLPAPAPPAAVDLVADVRYDPVQGSVLAPMAPAEVAAALLANAVCARRRPKDTIAAASAVARGARGVRGTRGEAGPAVPTLRAWR